MQLTPALQNEYLALTTGAGWLDVSTRTKIELRGKDRAAFLHNFCTNDIKRLQPGEACEAFVCNVKGHTVGYIHIYCDKEALWIDTIPGQAEKLISFWDRYLIREQVEFSDQTAQLSAMLLAGPRTHKLLEQLRTNLPGSQHALPQGPQQAQLLWCRPEELAEVVSKLADTGVVPCSPAAWEMVRIEAGYPEYGTDITEQNLPQEVGRDRWAISFQKGCYLGQETVARIDALGHVNQTLRGLVFPGSDVPASGTEIVVEGKPVARITSAAWSPSRRSPLALAYVRRGFETPGTKLGTAEVVTL